MTNLATLKPRHEANNPQRAGQLASGKEYFGLFGQYAVFAVHTRGTDVCWFVTDAELPEDGFPTVVSQHHIFEMAIARFIRMDPVTGEVGTECDFAEYTKNGDILEPYTNPVKWDVENNQWVSIE